MKPYIHLLIIISLLTLTGCYTQFELIDNEGYLYQEPNYDYEYDESDEYVNLSYFRDYDRYHYYNRYNYYFDSRYNPYYWSSYYPHYYYDYYSPYYYSHQWLAFSFYHPYGYYIPVFNRYPNYYVINNVYYERENAAVIAKRGPRNSGVITLTGSVDSRPSTTLIPNNKPSVTRTLIEGIFGSSSAGGVNARSSRTGGSGYTSNSNSNSNNTTYKGSGSSSGKRSSRSSGTVQSSKPNSSSSSSSSSSGAARKSRSRGN